MKNNMNIYFGFVMCIGFTIALLALAGIDSRNRNLQTQIDELRLLFNQKFLQEMVTDKPKLRTLEYYGSDKSDLVRIEI